MRRCHEHHRQPLVPALVLASVLIFTSLAMVPVEWIRWVFQRELVDEAEGIEFFFDQYEWVHLVPAPVSDAGVSEVLGSSLELLVEESVVDDLAGSEAEHRWSYDPFVSASVSSEMFDDSGVALTDSLRVRAEFLRSLTLTDMSQVYAMFDTTQVAVAREQFRSIWNWRSAMLGPMWRAEGRAARNAEVFRRVVTEVEREGWRWVWGWNLGLGWKLGGVVLRWNLGGVVPRWN